jgi:hypothetical protein
MAFVQIWWPIRSAGAELDRPVVLYNVRSMAEVLLIWAIPIVGSGWETPVQRFHGKNGFSISLETAAKAKKPLWPLISVETRKDWSVVGDDRRHRLPKMHRQTRRLRWLEMQGSLRTIGSEESVCVEADWHNYMQSSWGVFFFWRELNRFSSVGVLEETL